MALTSLLPAEPWRRNQIAVSAAAGLLFFGFTLVMPFLPYLIESLGARGHEVEIWSGLVLFTAPCLAALMGPIWGRMTDRYGMKIMLQRIVVAMILHWTLMYFVGSLAHLMVLRVMLGMFSGFGTISVALVTHGVPRDKVGGVVGTLQAVQILSAATGPAVGGLLFDRVGLRPTFLITAAICGAGFLLVTVAYREIKPGDQADPDAEERPLSFREILARPGTAAMLTLLFVATLVDRSFGLIVPLFLQDLVGPGSALGAWSGLTVSAGLYAGAASAFFLGRRAGRGRPRRLVRISLTAGAALMAAMAFAPGAGTFALLRVGLGLAAGGLTTLGYTIAAATIGDRSRATSYGMLAAGAMMGGAFGPLTAGLLAPVIGFRGYLVAAAAVFLILALLARRGARPPHGEVAQPYVPLPR